MKGAGDAMEYENEQENNITMNKGMGKQHDTNFF